MGTPGSTIAIFPDIVKGYDINEKKVCDIANSILEYLNLHNFELSIALVNSEEIKKLNKKYRNQDVSTDVLSFPQIDNFSTDSSGLLGDIVISIEDAQKNAYKIHQALDKEVAFLIIHGILHLIGFDHIEKKEEEQMINMQKKVLQNISPKDGCPALWEKCIIHKERYL